MPNNPAGKSLRVLSVDGLCNRLIVLLSGMVIAQASGRSFSMDWVPANTCNCPFELLFENDWNVRQQQTFDPSQWRDLRRTPLVSFPDLVTAPEHELRIRYNNWLLMPVKFPGHVPLYKNALALFRELSPIAELADRINAFESAQFRASMIGVHLRRGDYIVGRPDRVENLDRTTSVVDEWLDHSPQAGIFLCTDDGAPEPFSSRPSPYQGVRESLQKRYGGRVVTPAPRSLDRASPEAIQDALVELWLLRRVQYFVGTTDSTFSELAALGRDIPITMTFGQTQAHQKRLRMLKRTGVYSLLMALGRLEFGGDTTYQFISALYKERSVRFRQALRGLRR